MKRLFLYPSHLSLITNIVIFLIVAPRTQAADFENYTLCSQKYDCGTISDNIKYPFSGNDRPSYCGIQGFEVMCQKDLYPIIDMDSQSFRVLNIDRPTQSMAIARTDLWDSICTENFVGTYLDTSLFEYSPGTELITLYYSCEPDILASQESRYEFQCGKNTGFFVNETSLASIEYRASQQCEENITVHVFKEHLEEFRVNKTFTLPEMVKSGFKVVYDLRTNHDKCTECEGSRGVCGINTSSNEFTCFCKNGAYSNSCPGKNNVGRNIGVGFGVAGGVILIVGIIFAIFRGRKKKGNLPISSWESRNISSYGSSVLDLEKSHSSYGVQVFDYKELQEATNNFDETKELGDGGFGIVYKGKLRDGRVVAVKRLYERNFKRIEQFMTEVKILTRLRHRNLVTLYGCTSRHSRELVLVYEYISNGTVADHLHGEQAKPGSLSWTTRMSIAIDTANALAFLHASDVIHRDVKTNNILLDDNFCVKVADFGLSRLYPTNVTHVSTAPQGTPGYVDPEYHQCYQLTTKSDVYSFGVVLIELISSMPAVDITRHRHNINLSNLAIEKIQNHELHELVDPHLGFDSDIKVKKMVNCVAELAFRCLQNGREMRPSMEEVSAILQGISNEDYEENNFEEIEIPPEDDVLLSKSDPPTMSPDSVMSNIISIKTTPNTSS